MTKQISETYSLEGWDILKFLNGQRKTLITLIGGAVGYFIFNTEIATALTALIVAGVYSLTEYFCKKVDNRV